MKELIRQLKNALHTNEYELMSAEECAAHMNMNWWREEYALKMNWWREEYALKMDWWSEECTEDELIKGRMHCVLYAYNERMLMMAVCRMWMPLQWQSGTVCYCIIINQWMSLINHSECIIINQWMSLINHSEEWANGMLLYNQWMSRINHGKERVNGTEENFLLRYNEWRIKELISNFTFQKKCDSTCRIMAPFSRLKKHWFVLREKYCSG
jgi:hypothetical protein